MTRLQLLTAGESHGPCLTAIVEGLPAGLEVDLEAIDHQLRRRQGGYGRGGRMKIESDRVQVLGGVITIVGVVLVTFGRRKVVVKG